MVVANGRGYYTAKVNDYPDSGTSAGGLFGNPALDTSGSTYKTKGVCSSLILISKTGSLPCTACPAGESRDSGAREHEAYVCEFGEERMLHQNI